MKSETFNFYFDREISIKWQWSHFSDLIWKVKVVSLSLLVLSAISPSRWPTAYQTHMLQHDGKKPNSCNQCGYSSRQIFQLHTVQILLFNNLRSSMLKPIQEKNLSSARVQVMFGSIPPELGVNTKGSHPLKKSGILWNFFTTQQHVYVFVYFCLMLYDTDKKTFL